MIFICEYVLQVMMSSILELLFVKISLIWVACVLWVQVWKGTTSLLTNELASMPPIFLKLYGKIKSLPLKSFLMNVFLRFSDGSLVAKRGALVPVYLSGGSCS